MPSVFGLDRLFGDKYAVIPADKHCLRLTDRLPAEDQLGITGTEQKSLQADNRLQALFSELSYIGNEPVGLRKPDRPVETLAFNIRQFTVTGEFQAALFPGPGFAGGKETAGNSPVPDRFLHIDSLQVADRT